MEPHETTDLTPVEDAPLSLPPKKAPNLGKKILEGIWMVLKWILIILFFPLSLLFVAYFRRRRKY